MSYVRRDEPDHSMWWQVAIGVFIAMMAHSIVTGLYARHEANQAMKQLNAEAAKFQKTAARYIEQTTTPRQALRPQSTSAPREPLRNGERCIRGDRFIRASNGWIHDPRRPC